MSTVLQVIEDALREINVISEVGTASPEQGKFALRKLNQMMNVWAETMDIDLGYFNQDVTTGIIPIPEWAELAVTNGLAIAIAPKYGATVSVELAAVADATIGSVQSTVMIAKKEGVDLSYLPIGSGHYGRGNNILTDS